MDRSRWLSFVSDASKVLSASLDYRETLESIARLAVPSLADWCEILMLEEDGSFRRATVLHRDPARLELAREYACRWPVVRLNAPPLGSSPPQLVTGELAALATSDDELAMLRALGVRSIMMCPLVARRRVLGLLMLSTSESGRELDDVDVALVEELASRAALAVDNSRLYQAAQQARADADRALQARVESERQMFAILDNTTAIIYLTDLEGRLRLVNRTYEQRIGRPRDELIGKTLYDLAPAELAATIYAREHAVMREGRPLEFVGTYPSGRSYLELKFPITDDKGTIIGVGGVSTDITERKRAEEELRQSQERLEKVFRASTLAIGITRADDARMVQVNPAFENLTGYRAEELVGRTGSDLGLWERMEDRQRLLERLRTEGRVSGYEGQLRDRNGVLHDVLMSVEIIELAGQQCWLWLGHDVTDMNRLKERLEKGQRMESLGRLAGGVAHDFNNLLTAIIGYNSLVREGTPPDSAIHQAAEHIERAAMRAAALTRQLLVFGRQQVRQLSVVDLNSAVTGLLSMLQRLIGEHIHLETSLSSGAGGVEIDPAQLEQVILNLALNARDAMLSGGRLRIETALVDGEVRLRVEDDGVGMDEATRARIFEPFFTTKEVGKGTGLGLATVYSIVEQAGGRITVESAAGNGSRFDVLLPQASGPVDPAPAPPLAATASSRKETVLLVEDDESVREFVCMVLKSARYFVLTATDGESALRLVEAHTGPLHLLLTDIVMPHRDGRSLASELRCRVPSLRVMYMSGYPGDTSYDAIPPSDTFLQKPFTREGLLTKVAEVLRR